MVVKTYCSSAAEATKAVSSTYGRLRSVLVTNVAGATRYLWIFDGASAAGTLLCPPIAVESDKTVALSFDGDESLAFATGLFVASSTDISSYSVGGSDFLFLVNYSGAS